MEIEYTGRQTTITKKLKAMTEADLGRVAKIVGGACSGNISPVPNKAIKNGISHVIRHILRVGLDFAWAEKHTD